MADDKVIASIELSKALGLKEGEPISAEKLMRLVKEHTATPAVAAKAALKLVKVSDGLWHTADGRFRVEFVKERKKSSWKRPGKVKSFNPRAAYYAIQDMTRREASGVGSWGLSPGAASFKDVPARIAKYLATCPATGAGSGVQGPADANSETTKAEAKAEHRDDQ
jgi:hypothetical protein